MSQPAALLFDLDGTLVDSAIMIAAALSELSAARGGRPVTVARARILVGRGAAVLVREALGEVAGDGEADVAAFREVLAAIPPDPAMVFPGVVECLSSLTADGHACAVVTNKPERLATLLLEQLDMARFFTAVVGGDTLPVCKPDPAPLQGAIASLGAAGRSAVMIGDSDIDARAAAAARVPFVLYLGGYEARQCSEEAVAASFASFHDLRRLIQTLPSAVRPRGDGEATGAGVRPPIVAGSADV